MSDERIAPEVLQAARAAFLDSRRGHELPAFEAAIRAADEVRKLREECKAEYTKEGDRTLPRRYEPDEDGWQKDTEWVRLVSDWRPVERPS